jgi:hypothetical protein
MAHSFSRSPLNEQEHAARAAQGRAAPQHFPTANPGEPASAVLAQPITHVNLDRCRLSLIKGEHRWRFRWERGSEPALISAVADLARDPRANFDWFDAAVVCRHIVGMTSPTAPILPLPKTD